MYTHKQVSSVMLVDGFVDKPLEKAKRALKTLINFRLKLNDSCKLIIMLLFRIQHLFNLLQTTIY